MNKYTEAVRYAGVIEWNLDGRELVHNAWIKWHEKKGKDLLDEHIGTIKQAIKWQRIYENSISKKKFMKDGVNYIRQFLDANDFEFTNNDNPEKDLIFSETKEVINSSLTKERKEVFDLMIQGASQVEIAEELGKSQQSVNYLFNKIKKKVKIQMKDKSAWQNPFNASNIKVTKIITLSQWERRTDKEDYTLDGFCQNEYYEIQVHNESGDGILVKLPPSKINPSI